MTGLRLSPLIVCCAASMAVAAMTYETRRAEDGTWLVGIDGDVEVMVQPARNGDLELRLKIVNHGDADITFVPVLVRGFAETHGEADVRRRRLKTYEGSQYEEIRRRRKHQYGDIAPSGITVGKREGPAPRLSAKQAQEARESRLKGNRRKEPPSKPRESVTSSPVGQPARPEKPGPAPEPEPYFLKRSTLAGSESIAGSVFLKYKPADSYHVVVPIGEMEFEFDFALPDE